MRHWTLFVLLLLPGLAIGQSDKLTLEDIWKNGTYRAETVSGLRSMADGLHYTASVSGPVGASIVRSSYATGQEVGTVVKASELVVNGRLINLQEYHFNADETQVLIATDEVPLYRHSSSYIYYTFELGSRKIRPVAQGAHVFHATFSPSSDRVAYVKDNDIWVEHLTTGKTDRITTDGKQNAIINGMSDWVYEEEFAFTQAFQWSPDGTHLAYYRFDETAVKEFTMTRYDGQLYPTEQRFKYPKAGEANSIVSIHIANTATGTKVKVDVGAETDQYIPRIKWTQDGNVLSVQRLNRLQNKWELLLADASTGGTSVIVTEESKTYIDITDNLTFLQDGKGFIITSEKDGYNHIYLHDMQGKQLRQLTSGNWMVTQLYGVNAKGTDIFYQSTEEGSTQRHIYAVALDGKRKTKLTPEKGHNDADFSTGMRYFINRHSTASIPTVTTLHDDKGRTIRLLKDNQRLKERFGALKTMQREFFTITPPHGTPLNAWMIKPSDFDASKQYPVLLYVYGGSGRTYVEDSWNVPNILWMHYMAQEGFVVVAMDPRGTDNRGRDFKHSVYMELGKFETEDCIETAKYLGSLPFVDAKRIGMFGWSYGGYLSSLAITKGADHFKAAIAVAPVTNWRYYDNIYTERFMRTPQENPNGYDQNSPVNHVEKMRGSYLLVHGSGDDNVHLQNSMAMIDALVAANKQFDLMVYPDLDHAIYSKHSRLHLFTKMTDFLKRNL
jgi:dipeptidyl-peptidase-4